MTAWHYPWDSTPAPETVPPDPAAQATQRKPRGRPTSATGAGMRVSQAVPAWRYHHLTVSGHAATVQAFAAAARGAGITPWQLDETALEEDVFLQAIAQPASRRTLSVEGCRILARQFRERVAVHQARANALVGHSRACPFDLHALLPVPAAILQLGPNHPVSLDWLRTHWGITDRLRQVGERAKPSTGRRLPAGHAVVGYGFFTAGDTPQAAMDQLAARWPTLRLALVPRPAD